MYNKFSSRVRQWNLERNGLFYDAPLEKSMLKEEFKEYLEAKTYVDRVDAWCDFVFVYLGTVAKYQYFWATTREDTIYTIGYKTYATRLDEFEEFFCYVTNHMVRELRAEFICDEEYVFNTCMTFVCEANDKKKAGSGKIKKGEDWVDPKEKIRDFLERL